MRKSIAILGENDALLEALVKESSDLAPVQVANPIELPVETAALVCLDDDAPSIAAAALQMSRRSEQMFDLVAMAIEAREGLPVESGLRLKQQAADYASALGLSEADTRLFVRGAMVHDIGNLKIPNDILLKKDLLTHDEWVLLRQHTQIGGDWVREIDGLRDTEPVVRWHHCRYDGLGYPDNLEGEQIPVLARAMKIVDVYCAMTSPRHYRESATSREDALQHIQEEAGKAFDPGLAQVFLTSGVAR